MANVFPQSKELADIIRSHGWAAVDVTQPNGVRAEWHEINRTPLAGQFEFGRMYLLVPQPRAGQTIEQAYKTTKGVPAILVENRNDARWDNTEMDTSIYKEGKPIPFTRLLPCDIKSEGQSIGLVSTSGEVDARLSIGMPEVGIDNRGQAKLDAWLLQPDTVAIKAPHAAEMFKNYFRIAQPEEYFAQPEPVHVRNLHAPDVELSQQAAEIMSVLEGHIETRGRIDVDELVVRFKWSWLATEEAVRYLLREYGGLHRRFEGGSQLLVKE